jgi:hypothetical protein
MAIKHFVQVLRIIPDVSVDYSLTALSALAATVPANCNVFAVLSDEDCYIINSPEATDTADAGDLLVVADDAKRFYLCQGGEFIFALGTVGAGSLRIEFYER